MVKNVGISNNVRWAGIVTLIVALLKSGNGRSERGGEGEGEKDKRREIERKGGKKRVREWERLLLLVAIS